MVMNSASTNTSNGNVVNLDAINKTLDKLNSTSSLFVRNKTKTDYNMHIRDENNVISIIAIPRSFVPIDLTAWAPVQQLKECHDLRAGLRGNIIELVSEQEAKNIIETNEGRIEYERLMNTLNLVTDDLLATSLDKSLMTEQSSALSVAAVGNMDEANDQVRDAMVNKSMSNQDRLALIISLDKEEPHLNKNDFEFILKVADTSQTELVKYANNRMKELTGLLSK